MYAVIASKFMQGATFQVIHIQKIPSRNYNPLGCQCQSILTSEIVHESLISSLSDTKCSKSPSQNHDLKHQQDEWYIPTTDTSLFLVINQIIVSITLTDLQTEI